MGKMRKNQCKFFINNKMRHCQRRAEYYTNNIAKIHANKLYCVQHIRKNWSAVLLPTHANIVSNFYNCGNIYGRADEITNNTADEITDNTADDYLQKYHWCF
jgi:hypothetical protein